MQVSSQHITGLAVGIGTAALALYLYKKNQNRVDNFLRSQGISIASPANDYASMTLEELVTEKERLEDLIAEREVAVVKQEE